MMNIKLKKRILFFSVLYKTNNISNKPQKESRRVKIQLNTSSMPKSLKVKFYKIKAEQCLLTKKKNRY